MNKLIDDLSILTTIPNKALNKLVTKSYYCINEAVIDTLLEDKNVVEIDIGLGTLYIQILDNSIKYKFIPSADLEKNVKNTVVNNKNNLQNVLENNLVNKIVNTYKDLL